MALKGRVGQCEWRLYCGSWREAVLGPFLFFLRRGTPLFFASCHESSANAIVPPLCGPNRGGAPRVRSRASTGSSTAPDGSGHVAQDGSAGHEVVRQREKEESQYEVADADERETTEFLGMVRPSP